MEAPTGQALCRFDALVKKKGGYSKVARSIGVSRQRLYDIKHGQRPSRKLAEQIDTVLGFSMRNWGFCRAA